MDLFTQIYNDLERLHKTMPLWAFVLFDLILFRGILIRNITEFVNTNIVQPIDRWLKHIFITPAFRFIKNRLIKTEHDMKVYLHYKNKAMNPNHHHKRKIRK